MSLWFASSGVYPFPCNVRALNSSDSLAVTSTFVHESVMNELVIVYVGSRLRGKHIGPMSLLIFDGVMHRPWACPVDRLSPPENRAVSVV